MKIFTIIFTIIGVGLIIFNLTQIDFSNPFGDKSVVALITIFAALCAILLLQILRLSKRVDKQLKRQK
ncbi:hypothetical protein [Oceanihabitans sediminis]|uniref:Uncharacterized protein n=1 Tax=Oceanihabitans sediminis TaxID=1812012 RepID=A0A368P6P4_9FLAO|nr:hypothetical protein [Oceanihabitans sediminis]MDX1278583.1 hypothetical protein [Oceanihabitans sediminis]MDX1772784.1 hypothetical protein [Oceanihabitans sediminis]RBP34455.1 hypothetical protein DFR65_101348 [Oceanihabitans sediminis]RCU58126.1 hypothetical protein DU428_01720 [Oceanihabitans sediminis]